MRLPVEDRRWGDQVSYVVVFSRCLIGAVFLVSAISKLRGRRQLREFVTSLRSMRLVPERLLTPVAVLVAVAELAVPLLLAPYPAPPVMAAAGLIVAAMLLTAFAAAIVIVLRRGVAASCRCFGGSGSTPFGRHHVARNAVLTLVALLGAYASLRQPALDWAAVTLAAPLGIVGALIVTRLDDLIELFGPAPSRRQAPR